MIKVLFLARHTPSAEKALKYIIERKFNIIRAVIRKRDEKLIEICRQHAIKICTEEDLISDYSNGLIEVDYLLSFYWKKAKAETLKIATKGNINFHPGPLPEARGSAYHISILEEWGYWGATAHYMDENYDTGDIIECRRFKVPKDIVNKDLVALAHEKSYELFCDIIDRIINDEKLDCVKQEHGLFYDVHKIDDMKEVNINDTREEIDKKIRAFWNPPYSGAQVDINGNKYTIINDEILKWIAKRI